MGKWSTRKQLQRGAGSAVPGANPGGSESPVDGKTDKWRGVCVCIGNCTPEGRERGPGLGATCGLELLESRLWLSRG